VRSEKEHIEDLTRGAYTWSLTALLLRMIGSSSFASYGLITTTVLFFPDPLERIQLTGRRYSVRPTEHGSEMVVMVMKSIMASGEGDHSAVESSVLAILMGTKSRDMYIGESRSFPVSTNRRISSWIVCDAGSALRGQ